MESPSVSLSRLEKRIRVKRLLFVLLTIDDHWQLNDNKKMMETATLKEDTGPSLSIEARRDRSPFIRGTGESFTGRQSNVTPFTIHLSSDSPRRPPLLIIGEKSGTMGPDAD